MGRYGTGLWWRRDQKFGRREGLSSRVVLVHVGFLFPHAMVAGAVKGPRVRTLVGAAPVPPSELVYTCAATARDEIPSAKSLHPGPKQL